MSASRTAVRDRSGALDACSTAPRGRARAAAALVLLLAAAVAITLAAGTRPSFDAYGWLDWGRMTLHGGLDTNAAPSWKPLPWVFTVVFALFGRGPELWLWMVTVTFVSLVGLACAGRLAWALAGAAPDPNAGKVVGAQRGKPSPPRSAAGATAGRLHAAVAAALAVLGLLAVHDQYPFGYLHYVLSAQSDPMVVAFVLGAAVCRLDARPGAAFALLLLAALGRPEAWPFLLAAGAWLWRERPAGSSSAAAQRSRCSGSGSRRSPPAPGSWRPTTRTRPATRRTEPPCTGRSPCSRGSSSRCRGGCGRPRAPRSRSPRGVASASRSAWPPACSSGSPSRSASGSTAGRRSGATCSSRARSSSCSAPRSSGGFSAPRSAGGFSAPRRSSPPR